MGVVKLSTAGIVNYEKYSNLRAGIPLPPTGSFDLLETQVLGSTAASVTFSSLDTLAAGYQHLQIRATIRDAVSFQNSASFRLRFNGDSGNNYAWHRLFGNGSSVSSGAGTTQSGIFGDNAGNGFYSGHVFDILDPFNTSKNTTARFINGYEAGSAKSISIHSGVWMNTAALSSIGIFTEGFGFVTGSRFSLYGIKAA